MNSGILTSSSIGVKLEVNLMQLFSIGTLADLNRARGAYLQLLHSLAFLFSYFALGSLGISTFHFSPHDYSMFGL
jgi:hypothetical protein